MSKRASKTVCTVDTQPATDNVRVPPTKPIHLRLGPEHLRMLDWLAKSDITDRTEEIRKLIKEEYDRRKAIEKKESGK